ncbi:T9SS type A sorting domain-containing protein, partial [candidate division WOR-3 bacterium]|nr:T9SS type A sorting domain-containing protein [candidate division WOR-3 bacterium]
THFENRLPCPADTVGYTLCGYIKTDNGNNAEVRIRFYQSRTSGYSLGSEIIGEIVGTTGWNMYYNNFTPPNSTNFIDVWLRSEGPQSGDGYTWFDNVGVVEWEEWLPLSAATTITTPNDYYWIQIRTDVETYNAQLSYEERIYNPQTSIRSTGKKQATCLSFQCYPNPAKSATAFQYYLTEPSEVTLKIYNILGQQVKNLVHKTEGPGLKHVSWDGRDNQGRLLGAGIYFCRMQVGKHEKIEKIILLK